MSQLQFVLGPSGSGKTEYIERKIIKESVENPGINYLFLVPEQSSMNIQHKLAGIHPNGGYFNIEVFGFNRLGYKIFEELNVRQSGILDDFGKSMVLRKMAQNLEKDLTYYSGCLDKTGFIDQLKSFMSELYQYGVTLDELREKTEEIKKSGRDNVLFNKLSDMIKIFEAFNDYMDKNSMIVAEQSLELLAKKLMNSRWLDKSVVVLDGFTGFTPIQLNVIRQLLNKASKVYMLVTIDEENFMKKSVAEHELFYLSSKTISQMKKLANEEHISICENIWPKDFGADIHSRWSDKDTCDELDHLEKNIFRYPYNKYPSAVKGINIRKYRTAKDEMTGVAMSIRELVISGGYRYKDIAVISGDIEKSAALADRVFPDFEITYFKDYTQPLRNNALIDGMLMLLDVAERDMSYESVFAFLKSGIISEDELAYEDVEKLENYVLKRGIRGFKTWNSKWQSKNKENATKDKNTKIEINEVDEINEIREDIMSYIADFVTAIGSRQHTVEEYVDEICTFINGEDISFESRLDENIYSALMEIFDKLKSIMSAEKMDVHTFKQVLDLGLKELTIGNIPASLDSVVVGDITRTRLDDIKVLFIVGANSGVIPKSNNRKQIVNDSEKSRLSDYGIELAPSDILNDYFEQFYLYLNMSKPKEKLYLSYTSCDSETSGENSPSYVISRITNIFPDLAIEEDISGNDLITYNSGKNKLIGYIERYQQGEEYDADRMNALLKLYNEQDPEFADTLKSAMLYSNIPEDLSAEVIEDITERLLNQSASQLETYAECEYLYFLKYVLELRERDKQEISTLDFGNIVHNALRQLYTNMRDKKESYLENFAWGQKESISYEDLEGANSGFDKMVEDAIDVSFEDNYSAAFLDEKYEYTRKTLKRVAKKAIGELFARIDGSDFKPERFEQRYEKDICVDKDGKTIHITGSIDRIDVKKSDNPEEENKIRVIDYKTGMTKFEIAKLYDGLQLQLSLYLSALTNEKEKAEGAYYFHFTDVWGQGDNVAKAENKRNENYELDGIGLPNYDQESVEVVLKYTDRIIGNLAKKMLAGNIQKNPFKASEEKKQCEYCKYKADCRFDTLDGGNKTRKNNGMTNSKDSIKNAVECMKAELEGADD